MRGQLLAFGAVGLCTGQWTCIGSVAGLHKNKFKQISGLWQNPITRSSGRMSSNECTQNLIFCHRIFTGKQKMNRVFWRKVVPIKEKQHDHKTGRTAEGRSPTLFGYFINKCVKSSARGKIFRQFDEDFVRSFSGWAASTWPASPTSTTAVNGTLVLMFRCAVFSGFLLLLFKVISPKTCKTNSWGKDFYWPPVWADVLHASQRSSW